MTQEKYLGMRAGDLEDKPYAKYWNPHLSTMQDHALRAIAHGPEASELGFPITDVSQLLQQGYLPLENGYTCLDNGQIFVSVLTKMPKVTGKMIDWWFGWHYMESQRYKLWHPRCHIANRAEKMIGDEPSLSDREKYLNNPNFVTEYIGSGLQDILITFSDASNFFDTSQFQESNISTAICGSVGLQKFPLNVGKLIHLIRETVDGCEMRSRFWIGKPEVRGLDANGAVNKIVGSRFVAKHAVSLEMGKELFVHCAMEMNHLVSFLPELYDDYHANT
ncbi:DAPG hydrolase family protein [Vibrio sp. 10N.261.51.F12]|uniref:DAPG hydrolase family protein n=1 Tax=Vibrio sp. 10N.261.51.F12 TaxID=3229679 RepID=UPI0035538D1F